MSNNRLCTIFLGAILLGAGLSLSAQIPLAGSKPNDGMGKPILREVRFEDFPDAILALDIARGSSLTVVAFSDRRVRVWRLETGEIVHDFTFGEYRRRRPSQGGTGRDEPIRVHFSPDGKVLAISYLSRIYFYDVSSWNEVKSLGVGGEDTSPGPSGQGTATSETGGSRDPEDKPPPRTRGDGRTRVADFAFTTDGRYILASYCREECHITLSLDTVLWAHPTGQDPIRLWDLATGEIVWQRFCDPTVILVRVVPSPAASCSRE